MSWHVVARKNQHTNLARRVADLGRPVLDRFSVKGYRSCLDVTFAPSSELSVLIGPNGAGKTSLLNAILLLQKLCSDGPSFRPRLEPTTVVSIRARFSFGDRSATFHAEVGLDTDEHNKDVIVASNERWQLGDFTGSRRLLRIPLSVVGPHFHERWLQIGMFERGLRDGAMATSDPDFKAAAPILTAIGQFLADASYFSASQFTDPSTCPTSIEIDGSNQWARTASRRPRGHAKFMTDLYAAFKQEGQPAFLEFLSIVGREGIGLVDDISFLELETSSVEYKVRSGGKIVQTDRKKSLVVPQFHLGENRLSPNQLSEGTFKTLALLFYVMTTQSSVLLVEEPEVCVHHGLLSSIVDLIKSHAQDKQIVLSTHSESVLDKFMPEQVFVVTRADETGTSVSSISSHLSRESMLALRDYLKFDGNLGEFWRAGGFE